MSETEQAQNLWRAPVAEHPLNATVTIPGSKSLSNRYLILAALGERPVTLVGLLRSRDTELMMGALESFGVRCEADANDSTTVRIVPPANGHFAGNVDVFCGLAGTVMRFVPGLALFADGPVHFDGDEQAYARPMRPVLDGLEQLGARIDYHGAPGHLPFTVTPPSLTNAHSEDNLKDGNKADNKGDAKCTTISDSTTPCHVAIDASGSSQFISGLLLIGSRLPGGLELTHTGEHLPSLPHIRMTVADLRSAGVDVIADESAHRWTVRPGNIQLPDTVVVEPDLSNAAPFLGATLIAGGSVSVPYWPRETTQPGGLLPGILQQMGADVTWNGKPWQNAVATDKPNDNIETNHTREVGSIDETEKTGKTGETVGTSKADETSKASKASETFETSGILRVTGSGTIHGLGRYDMSAAGEIAPSIAALAALADAPTQLVGIAHLRGHETNRLAALVTEITRIGAQARELEDGIEIIPVPHDRLHSAVMETYADHRMATFAAMIGLAVPGIDVVNVETTRKTIPDFVGMWTSMLEE